MFSTTLARVRSTTIAALLTLAAVPAVALERTIDRGPHETTIAARSVSFMARDLENGIDYILEGSDLDSRHSPFSTFKIANMVIALERGIAADLESWRRWDPERRPAAGYWPDDWKQGQTLRSAFERSVAWYFHDLAREVGGAAYREQLEDWAYGNADVPDGSDDFWLGKDLKISVREHVRFLDALVTGQLGVSQRSLIALHEVSRLGKAPGVSLHGKTGSGPDNPASLDGSFSGWFAGYLLLQDRAPVVFALHVSAPSYTALRDFRKDFSITLLEDAGLVDEDTFTP